MIRGSVYSNIFEYGYKEIQPSQTIPFVSYTVSSWFWDKKWISQLHSSDNPIAHHHLITVVATFLLLCRTLIPLKWWKMDFYHIFFRAIREVAVSHREPPGGSNGMQCGVATARPVALSHMFSACSVHYSHLVSHAASSPAYILRVDVGLGGFTLLRRAWRDCTHLFRSPRPGLHWHSC
jgi:hypothetical protein